MASLPDNVLLRRAIVVDTEGRTIEEYDAGRVDLHGDEKRVTRVYAADNVANWIRDRVCVETTIMGSARGPC